jgi:predicted alpha/beta hydrolase family esterase
VVSNSSDCRRQALPEWSALAQSYPVARRNALRQLAAAARFRAPGRPPAMPVLVLASTCDRLVDASCSRAVAKAWNADLIEHPRAGHDLALDDGPWLAATVASWWSTRSAARSARSSA